MRKSKEFFARALALTLAATMPLTMGSTSVLAATSSNAVVSTYDAAQASQVDLSTGYTFVYAGLNWNEYWASEGVYASGDATSSEEKDSHSELDKGAFDTVTRATANHGLHRGSYQCIATVYDDNGDKYELAGWTADGKNMILTDGSQVAFSRGTITKTDGTTVAMDYYEVSGIKYVPVAVKNEDYEAFCKAYKVAENASTIFGGYGELQLKAYSETAKVTATTNGLKVATKNSNGSFSFSARQTGTDSGIEGQTQKKATDITVTVKDASGSYGEFLRVDINGNGYGDLGANMQTVRWDYYGDDSTYSKPIASFGTKFAADNWMHKSNGIQLGLTDSLRCKLPTGTDGTGYWRLTVYALGYEDTVVDVYAEDKNIVKPAAEEVDTTTLEATIKKAEALNESDYTSDSWSSMQLELQEAKDELAKEEKTQAAIDEANTHLTAAIEALVKKDKDVYVLMNIPYDDFYKAEVTNDVKVDAFTSATKNKSRTKTLAGGSYHVNADGSDVTGITYAVKLGKGVTLESLAQKYKQVKDTDKVEISVTNRGQTSTTTYEGKDALFENASYAYYVLSEVPTSYKEATLDASGNITFSAVQNANVQKVTDVEATLLTQSSYGDYQLDLDGMNNYVGRNDAVYGVIISTKEGDSYGLRHLENIWLGSELSWATGFTTSVHGCPTSSEHYKKMMGQTITKVTYYTEKGNFEVDLGDGIYVPVKFDTTSMKVEDAKVDAGSTSVDVSALPSDYQATYSVSGLDDVKVENGKLTFATKDVKPGSYTLKVSDASKKYADVSVKFTLSTDADVVTFNNTTKTLVAVEGTALEDYVGNITSVNVDGKDYAASGRGATVIIKEDGSLDTTKAGLDSDARHTITVKATGYKDVTFYYDTAAYVLMNIPYDAFYKAEVTNDVKVDAFTSATKNKSRTKTLAGGSYHVNADGSDVTGITYAVRLGEGVTLESLAQKYKQVKDTDKVEISVTNRGQTSTTTYEGKDALFENASYAYYVLSEVPTSYKEATLDADGNITFGKVQSTDIKKVTDVEATLLTQSSYGDYQLDLDGMNNYVGRNDAVYGVIISTKEGDSYGLRHLENIWLGSELSWATGFTTSVHGCPTSSEHYKKMMGQTITKVTYYTEKGNFEVDLGNGIYVPVKFDTTSMKVEDAKVDAGSTSVDVSALPNDYQATYSVAGLSDVKVENGKLTFATKDVKPGSYTLKVSDANKKYADVSVKFTLSTDATVVAFNNNAKAPALVAVDGANLSDYVGNITSVNVDGTDYAASGRGATVIVKEDGTLDLTNEKVDLTSVGTHTVTVKATGYNDVTFSYQVKNDLSSVKATVKDVTYNGKAQTPAVTVEGLTLNKDYKVTYKNNVNAGKATATITGIGSYEGTKTVTFTIKKASSSVSLKAKTATYTGKPISIGKATVKGSTGKVTLNYYKDAKCTKGAVPMNVGTYYVKAVVKADKNYNGATSKAVKLTIKKANATIKTKTTSKTVKVKDVKKKAQSFSIGASANSKGKVTYKKSSGSKNLTVSSSGKVTVKKGTKKGTYSAKVKVLSKATANYNAASKTVTVKVKVK